jgi:hypothetical protein
MKRPAKVKPISRPQTRTTKPPTKKVSDTNSSRSYVIYGISGTGKTTLAGSFPKPALLLDINDKGTDSISDIKGIEVAECPDWETLEEWMYYLLENPKEYKTVIIDTVTQMQSIAIEMILKKKKKSTDRAGDWGTMSQREWGDVASEMKSKINTFRDLPLETVFLAQARVFNVNEDDMDEQEIAPEVGPRLSPSVKDAINAAVDVIGSTFVRKRIIKKKGVEGKKPREIEKTEYCLRVGPNPVYITKIRKPKSIVAPAVIIDPVYEDILEIIKGEA